MAFEILVRMLGDGSGFQRMLDEAKGRTANFGSSIKSRLAAAFSTGVVLAAMRANLNYAETISDLSKKLGVGTEKLQEWDYAAKMSGATLDQFAAAMQALSKTRAEALANPAGDAGGLFKAMGIDEASLRNSSIEQLFERIAETFRTTNFGADELAMVMKLLGKGGAELLPAFKDGLAAAGEEARKWGLVLSDEVVKQLDEAKDRFEQLSASATRLGAGPLVVIVKIIQAMVDGIHLAVAAIQDTFTNLLTGASGGFLTTFHKGKNTPKKSSAFYDEVMKGILDREAKAAAGGTKDDTRTQKAGMSAANAAKDELAAKKQLAELEEKLMTAAERRAKLEEAISDAMIQAQFIPDKEEQTKAIQRAMELAMKLDTDKDADANKFAPVQATSDSLSRVGGFVGASGNPQIDAIKRGQVEANRKLETGNKTQNQLLNEVQKLAKALLNP